MSSYDTRATTGFIDAAALPTAEQCRGGHVEWWCNFPSRRPARLRLAIARNIDSLPPYQPTRLVARMAERWVLLCRLRSSSPKL